jgi:hypothetical protein
MKHNANIEAEKNMLADGLEELKKQSSCRPKTRSIEYDLGWRMRNKAFRRNGSRSRS